PTLTPLQIILILILIVFVLALVLVIDSHLPLNFPARTNDNDSMKQPMMLEPALKEFRWNELANLHLDLSYCRHRLIQTVNGRMASISPPGIDELGRLAEVDERLKAALDHLEGAKSL